MQLLLNMLKNNEIVCLDTETLYGFSCNAYDMEAINNILNIKKRQKSMIVCYDTIERIKLDAILNTTALELSNRFWPGPLTLILECSKQCKIPNICKTNNSVAIKISKPLVHIIEQCDFPIISTSVNISGEESLYTKQEIKTKFPLIPIFDNDFPKSNIASTIIDCRSYNPIIIRQGEIII